MLKNVLVIVDSGENSIRQVSHEAISLARELTSDSEGVVSALIAGSNLGEAAERLTQSPADVIQVLDHESLAPFDPEVWCTALNEVIRSRQPDLVLMGQTYRNMDLAPRLSARLRTALVTGCTGYRKDSGEVLFVRPMFRGKLNADIRLQSPKPWLVTIQPGAFNVNEAAGSAQVEHLELEVPPTARSWEPLGTSEVARERVDLSRADVIVGVGRGIKKQENLRLAEDLADVLHAEIGASRPVVDSNWLERDRQIGSSGQTVSPRLYISLGISGAIQHVVGIKNSGCIVAVNNDPNAPIFNLATYGIVGDIEAIVPLLTQHLRQIQD